MTYFELSRTQVLSPLCTSSNGMGQYLLGKSMKSTRNEPSVRCSPGFIRIQQVSKPAWGNLKFAGRGSRSWSSSSALSSGTLSSGAFQSQQLHSVQLKLYIFCFLLHVFIAVHPNCRPLEPLHYFPWLPLFEVSWCSSENHSVSRSPEPLNPPCRASVVPGASATFTTSSLQPFLRSEQNTSPLAVGALLSRGNPLRTCAPATGAASVALKKWRFGQSIAIHFSGSSSGLYADTDATCNGKSLKG